jgi:hypothetical protein
MQSIHNRTRNKKNKKNTTTSEIPGKPLNQNKAVSAQENMRSIVLKQNLTTTGKTKDPFMYDICIFPPTSLLAFSSLVQWGTPLWE